MEQSTTPEDVVNTPADKRTPGPCRIVWSEPDAWSSFTPLRYDPTTNTLTIYKSATEADVQKLHNLFEAPWDIKGDSFHYYCPAARFGLPRNAWANLLLELRRRTGAPRDRAMPTSDVQAIQALGYRIYMNPFPWQIGGNCLITDEYKQIMICNEDPDGAVRKALAAIQQAAV